ncbi:M1 family aminopeptidase [Fulvimonas sp. R45]|uniref:ABC transporter permease/M1 family aminopeptidase n=1 Tax=Fulvimonas sp. R45 TaxID=3045937 RepID=UPI00266032AA|nr:M1 family aminopeptidase [Fulvimonas sp. R45]MDO1527575.1 M1 family aminopeptidase [Fulvimonas sp. R45]
MFLEILRFELRQQLKAPLFWVIAAVFAGLAFMFSSTDAVILGGAHGNVLRNAPLVIVRLIDNLTPLCLLLAAAFVAGAALRDFDHGTSELVFATPVRKRAYLGGRFAAGYLVTVAIMLLCALGLALGGSMPWIEAARLGPSDWHGYAWAFGVMVLPNLLFIAAMLFLLATATRSLLATLIGVIAFIVLLSIAKLLTQDVNHHALAAILDPFGGRTLQIVTRYWTPDRINRALPPLDGLLLFNRLLWMGVSLVLAGTAFALFRTDREGLRLRRRPRRAEPPLLRPASAADAGATALPPVRLAAGWRARLAQLRHLLLFDARSVLRGVPFLVLLLFGLVNFVFSLALSGRIYGTATWPVTHGVLEMMRSAMQGLLYIVVMFYAGELVWRERSQRTAEVSDAFPLPDWIPLAAKLGALLAVAAAFLAAGAAVGIAWQLAHGYTHLEPGLYLGTLALQAVPFALLAALALFLQVVTNNRYLGYLLTVLWLVCQIAFPLLHWDHNLYNYAAAPSAPYSDLNGFGHFLPATLWFDFYWACLAVVLLVLAALFWVRGTGQSWRGRLREARARCRRPARVALALGLLAFAASGAWIFYNTNVLNHYENGTAKKRDAADYEKLYAKYRDAPQPRITAVSTQVDIHPYHRRLEIRGRYTLVNKTAAPIDTLYVNLDTDFTRTALDFAPHETVSDDKRLGFAVYRLKTPLAPGASMPFGFDLTYAPRGFTNEPRGQFLAHNGSFFNSGMLPQFGYQPSNQLTDRNDRRKYGLKLDVPRMPPLGDAKARANTYISNDADWVDFDTTVSTASDQTALAPGVLQKAWTAGGRRYFHYVSQHPMLNFAAWMSARWAVKRVDDHGTTIAVYYNPAHAWNVDRMIEGTKDALAYYDAHYTPYPFRQLRIAEVPNYYGFAQSFPNTIAFSEALGFIADLRDTSQIDYPYYVTAHEVAHQWWAHRVIGADMQGSTMLSESLAQYSALMVMKQRYGADQMRKFLKYELDKYLAGRATDTVAEEPLAKVENEQYVHYNKGSVVFYALQDYVGEDRLDAVLKQFLLDKGFQQPPYTTSKEFMDALSGALGPPWRPLLDDFFWKITLFDNRITSASAKKLPDGRYEVTMKLHAGMAYADGKGRETPAAPDIPIQIGVFAAPDAPGRDGRPLYLARRMLPDGDSTVTVTVDGKPASAGIDPYNELIDQVPTDNRMPVSVH